MKRLLSAENEAILTRFARSRALVAFDFDGTLASIVADRDQAALRPDTERLLSRLCAHYPCAVISGRSRADLGARLGAAAVKYTVGNHGLEPGRDLALFAAVVARVRRRLERALACHAGLDIEDKRYSLAVHYRRSPSKRAARAAIHGAISALPEALRVVPGKLVLNVIPGSAPNKGDAVLDLREREGAQTALYVGDDVTDEDVFKLDHRGRLISARIRPSRTSAARYFLRDQAEIDALLARLVELRSGAGPS